jgi:hypothetical protein
MSPPPRRRLVIGVAGVILTGAGIGVTLQFLRQGIDYVDKMSSVISMVIGLLSLALGAVTLRLTLHPPTPPPAPSPPPGGGRGTTYLNAWNSSIVNGDGNQVTIHHAPPAS